jgi:hypothetical protein
VDIRHVELEGSLQPATGQLQLEASMDLAPIGRPLRQLFFRLAWELPISVLGVNGQATEFERYGDLVIVPLSESVQVGQTLNVTFTYGGQLLLPDEISWEDQNKDLIFAITRWFPSVNDDSLDVFDLFTCRVVLEVPRGYRWASAIVLREEDGKTVYEWESTVPVQYVPLCVGRFEELHGKYRDIPISVCTFSVHPSAAQQALEVSAAALDCFERAFGPYPFPCLSIAEQPFHGASGHAFAGLVTVRPDTLRRENMQNTVDYLLPHEIGHQWWGNAMPPWMGEAGAVYSNFHFIEETQGRTAATDLFDNTIMRHFRPDQQDTLPLAKDMGAGVSKHIKGGYLLIMLQSHLGKAALLDALRGFYQDHENLPIAIRSDWSQALSDRLEASAGESLGTFLHDWLWRVKRFDPAISAVRQEKSSAGYDIRLTLEHREDIRFPVSVRVSFADGSQRMISWETLDARKEVAIQSDQPLVMAEIDPEHMLLDWDRGNNRGYPDSKAQEDPRDGRPELKYWTTYAMDDGLSAMDVRCLRYGNGHMHSLTFSVPLLVGGRWGLDYFDTQWRPFEPREDSSAIMRCLAHGAGADLWIGGNFKLWRIRDNQITAWSLKEGRLGGKIGAGQFVVNTEANSSIWGSKVLSLLADTSDTLWVGTDHGVDVFNSRSNRWRHYSQADGLPGQEIFALSEDDEGTTWAGTEHGLARFDGERWTLSPDCPDDLVLSLAAGPQGALWAGTYRFGLLRIHQGQVHSFTSNNSGLPHNMVSALVADASGRIWAGTSAGLASFDGKAWQHFDRLNSGLPSDQVQCLALDDVGHLWIGTNAGIARYAK